MRSGAHIIIGSLYGLMVLGACDCALAAAASPPASCLSAGLAGVDADTIKVDAVTLPATVKCAAEDEFLGELKKRMWLAFTARARPRLLPQYDYDVQRFASSTWSTPVTVRVTQCPGRMGAPVASAECVPSFALEEAGGNDIANLAGLEAVAAALAAGTL
jgi:hypothetical protein